jgi:hypothetical protein
MPMPAAAPAPSFEPDVDALLELAEGVEEVEVELVVEFNGYTTAPFAINSAALGALNVSFVGAAQSSGAKYVWLTVPQHCHKVPPESWTMEVAYHVTLQKKISSLL